MAMVLFGWRIEGLFIKIAFHLTSFLLKTNDGWYTMFKKSMLALCVFHFCILAYLSAEDSYWDSRLVRNYVHNSDLQRRWAWAFLAPNLQKLKGDEQILDIGCGDGKVTADISKFIPQGTILGIDPSTSMLDWAKKQYCALEYPNLSFQEGGLLDPNVSQTFDIVISNCAIQHCSDQPQAFQNLANLLKTGGKLWILIPTMDNEAWNQARKTIQASPKWSCYWQNIMPRKFLTIEEFTSLLQQANLNIQRIEKIKTADPFVDREEFLAFLLGTFNPAVPSDMAKEFFNEMIDEYIRLLPDVLKSNGVLEVRFGRIEAEATKP